MHRKLRARMAKGKGNKTGDSTASLGFEANLWLVAGAIVPGLKLDSLEDKSVCARAARGFVFLKSRADTFSHIQRHDLCATLGGFGVGGTP